MLSVVRIVHCAVVSVQVEGNSSTQGSLASTLGAAAVVWAVRVGAVYCGSWLGAWLGGTPPEHRRRVWYGMITQVCTAPRSPALSARLGPLRLLRRSCMA